LEVWKKQGKVRKNDRDEKSPPCMCKSYDNHSGLMEYVIGVEGIIQAELKHSGIVSNDCLNLPEKPLTSGD